MRFSLMPTGKYYTISVKSINSSLRNPVKKTNVYFYKPPFGRVPPEPELLAPELEPDVPGVVPVPPPLVVLDPLPCVPVSVPAPGLFVRIPESILLVFMPVPAAFPVPVLLVSMVVPESPEALPLPSLLQALKKSKSPSLPILIPWLLSSSLIR